MGFKEALKNAVKKSGAKGKPVAKGKGKPVAKGKGPVAKGKGKPVMKGKAHAKGKPVAKGDKGFPFPPKDEGEFPPRR